MLQRWLGVLTMALVALSMLAGCASSGRQFNNGRIDAIRNGEQDRGTITAWFGPPLKTEEIPEGHPRRCVERWTYVYAYAAFFGAATQSQTLVVDFDDHGKVCDHAYLEKK